MGTDVRRHMSNMHESIFGTGSSSLFGSSSSAQASQYGSTASGSGTTRSLPEPSVSQGPRGAWHKVKGGLEGSGHPEEREMMQHLESLEGAICNVLDRHDSRTTNAMRVYLDEAMQKVRSL